MKPLLKEMSGRGKKKQTVPCGVGTWGEFNSIRKRRAPPPQATLTQGPNEKGKPLMHDASVRQTKILPMTTDEDRRARRGRSVVHLRTSLMQLFVLFFQFFEKVVQINELKRFGGTRNGCLFARLGDAIAQHSSPRPTPMAEE